MPEVLFEASKEYYQALGYRNFQEFVLDLVRKKVVIENLERYQEIEERMKRGIGTKRFDKKGAIRYLRGL